MKKIELFYSPACPHCPKARQLLESYRLNNPGFAYNEVNTYTEAGIERGMSLQVMSVPCIVVNDEIKITGWPFTVDDLETAIV